MDSRPTRVNRAMDSKLRRVNREIASCNDDTRRSGVKIELVDDSPFHLKGSFHGPQGTPYEGGCFEVDIVIPESYPFKPLEVKFINKVYHPNTSSTSGAVCVDILKEAWCPALSLEVILISVQSLLSAPEPSTESFPEEAEVAKHYMTNQSSFEDTARHWTQIYAGKSGPKEESGGTDEIAIGDLQRA